MEEGKGIEGSSKEVCLLISSWENLKPLEWPRAVRGVCSQAARRCGEAPGDVHACSAASDERHPRCGCANQRYVRQGGALPCAPRDSSPQPSEQVHGWVALAAAGREACLQMQRRAWLLGSPRRAGTVPPREEVMRAVREERALTGSSTLLVCAPLRARRAWALAIARASSPTRRRPTSAC